MFAVELVFSLSVTDVKRPTILVLVLIRVSKTIFYTGSKVKSQSALVNSGGGKTGHLLTQSAQNTFLLLDFDVEVYYDDDVIIQ